MKAPSAIAKRERGDSNRSPRKRNQSLGAPPPKFRILKILEQRLDAEFAAFGASWPKFLARDGPLGRQPPEMSPLLRVQEFCRKRPLWLADDAVCIGPVCGPEFPCQQGILQGISPFRGLIPRFAASDHAAISMPYNPNSLRKWAGNFLGPAGNFSCRGRENLKIRKSWASPIYTSECDEGGPVSP